jgi:hypothetical protein
MDNFSREILSQQDEHFGIGGLIHTLTESVQKIGQ